MAESFNGLCKWELIHKQGPWRGLDDVEIATMTCVGWFDHRRLHGEITNDASYTTPAEAEADYHRQNHPAAEATKSGALHRPEMCGSLEHLAATKATLRQTAATTVRRERAQNYQSIDAIASAIA